MAGSNTRGASSPRGPFSIEEHLAPLTAAQRQPPTGRVRSLDEARRALRIPASSAPDVLQAWGVPADQQLVVYPVAEPDSPDLVAEFALLRVITRKNAELVAREPGTRIRLAEKSNALWIIHGSIVVAADATLVIETLAIGPAFEGQLTHKHDDIALGITGQLLRLISPPRLLSACSEQLAAKIHWLEATTPPHPGATSEPPHRELLERLERGRPRHSRITDNQLAEIAKRYIELDFRGITKLREQLAKEFGITHTQARDRIHQARACGYLTAGTQGRRGAQPGPRLLALGWTPPQANRT